MPEKPGAQIGQGDGAQSAAALPKSCLDISQRWTFSGVGAVRSGLSSRGVLKDTARVLRIFSSSCCSASASRIRKSTGDGCSLSLWLLLRRRRRELRGGSSGEPPVSRGELSPLDDWLSAASSGSNVSNMSDGITLYRRVLGEGRGWWLSRSWTAGGCKPAHRQGRRGSSRGHGRGDGR
eukprot:4142381-Prymnesium_polylepis.2